MTFMRFPATRPAPAPLPSGPRPSSLSSPSGSRTVGKSQAAGQMRAKRKPTRKKKLEKLLGRFTMPRHVNIWRHLYKKKEEEEVERIPVRHVLIKAIISKMPAKATYSSISRSSSLFV